MGADGVELDVRRTADDNLAVHHDALIGRTVGSTSTFDGRAIFGLSAGELASLGPGLVPMLDEVLDVCRPTLVNIEIKSDPNDADFDGDYPVVDLILGLLADRSDDNVLVTSFDLAAVDAVVERSDTAQLSVRTGYLIADPTDAIDAVQTAVDHGHAGIMPHYTMVEAAFMAAARNAGLFVGTWTVNDPKAIEAMLKAGVDAIISDTPDIALALRDGAADGSR